MPSRVCERERAPYRKKGFSHRQTHSTEVFKKISFAEASKQMDMSADDISEQRQSSVSSNGKGRNKRKCISNYTPVSLTEFPRYEMLEQQFRKAFKQLGSIAEKKSKDTTANDREVGEWDNLITFQLAELLSDTLSTTFSEAMKKLVESGHTQQVAEWAVLNSSLFNCGNKDTISNVVDGALALLKLDEHVEMPKHSVFESLRSLVEYTLLEMIHIVLEIRPTLTVTEAMWCLLISELNLAIACGHKSLFPEASEPNQELDPNELGNLKPGDPRVQNFRPETLVSGPAQQEEVSNQEPNPGNLGYKSSLSIQELTVRVSGVKMDERFGGDGCSKKEGPPSIIIEKEFLQKKPRHYEKHYKGRMGKATFKAKVAAWGSMVLENSLKMQPKPPGAVNKENHSGDNNNTPVKDPVIANSDAHPKKIKKTDGPDPPKQPTDYYANIPFDESIQKYVPKDNKDKALLMLVPVKTGFDKELQGWADWTNEKIMEAARKLGKDQVELKALRQEKEEIEKVNKEKQAGEESNVKRLKEMGSALANANRQIGEAMGTVHRLEEENSVLKTELQEARMDAIGTGVRLGEAVVREQEMERKLRVWQGERDLVLERLNCLKRKVAEIEKQLAKAKNRLNQFQVLLRHEEKEKLKAENVYNLLMAKREEEDALRKTEVNNIKQMDQKNKKKCEDEIKNLSSMVSELKLESDKLTIAALSVGYGPNVSTWKQDLPKVTKRLSVFQDIYKGKTVKPERECVMCMNEEISVVFLPCAHQILCVECSNLHEKLGTLDCPSCRATIDKRVHVTYGA